MGLRRLAGDRDVGGPLLNEQHAGNIVVDEALENAENLRDGLFEALRGRGDAGDLGGN